MHPRKKSQTLYLKVSTASIKILYLSILKHGPSKQDFSSNDCQKILQEAFPHEIRGNKLMEVLYLK